MQIRVLGTLSPHFFAFCKTSNFKIELSSNLFILSLLFKILLRSLIEELYSVNRKELTVSSISLFDEQISLYPQPRTERLYQYDEIFFVSITVLLFTVKIASNPLSFS